MNFFLAYTFFRNMMDLINRIFVREYLPELNNSRNGKNAADHPIQVLFTV